MFLHVGNDVVVRFKDIIAILDMETTTVSKITRGYLNSAQEKGFVINVSEDLPKSFIVAQKGKAKSVYISHISSATLLKRIGEPYGSDD